MPRAKCTLGPHREAAWEGGKPPLAGICLSFGPWRDRWRVRRFLETRRVGSAARMRVQVQVRLATLPETPLYKAI
jgi:hypothetical protein